MPLTTQHRMALFDAISPIAGEEATEALLSDHPTNEGDELVTKDLLRAEMADVRSQFADVRTEIADVRSELRSEIGDLRAEMHLRFAAQTRWMVGLWLSSVGIAMAISRLG